MYSGDFFIVLKSAIFWLLHIGLAATSFLFVQETIKDYLQRKTEYHQSKLHVTIRDLPTYTFCIKDFEGRSIFGRSRLDGLEYGKDILIFHFNLEEKFWNFGWTCEVIKKPLSLGKNTLLDKNGRTHHRELMQLNVLKESNSHATRKKCFKISLIEKVVNDALEATLEGISFGIEFINQTDFPDEVRLLITSDDNAYGATIGKWYNGNVKPHVLKRNNLHYINLQVKEFRHLQDLCQEQSYYQCLASEFFKNKTCNGTCLPFPRAVSQLKVELQFAIKFSFFPQILEVN